MGVAGVSTGPCMGTHPEGGGGDPGGDRIAAVRGAVLALADGEHDLVVCKHGGRRVEPTGEGFAEDEDVRARGVVVGGEHLAGACEPCMRTSSRCFDIEYHAWCAGRLRAGRGGGAPRVKCEANEHRYRHGCSHGRQGRRPADWSTAVNSRLGM